MLEPGGHLEVFRHGAVTVPMVVRPLPAGAGTGFDVISPYDYTGPLGDAGVVAEAWSSLQRWAAEHDVLTGFFRFHPYRSRPQAWARESGMEIVTAAEHVVVDLSDPDALPASFKPQVRRDLKVARRAGVSCAFRAFDAAGLDVFVPMYWASLDRLGADPYYRFSRPFFDRLAEQLSDRVILGTARIGERPVASTMILLDGETAFYYLACSTQEGRRVCAMNALVHDAVMELARRGLRRFHLGGGSEGLRAFKTRFSPHRVPYFVGKAVFDRDRYARLRQGRNLSFFPVYRDPAWNGSAVQRVRERKERTLPDR